MGLGLLYQSPSGTHNGFPMNHSTHKNNVLTKLRMVISLPLLLVVLTQASQADVSMPAVFSNHMVLQRDLEVPIWGKAAPGEEVRVAFAGQEETAITDEFGHWTVTLKPMPASATPRAMTIQGNNRIDITDVLIGEVWVCGGQSNMEWTINNSNNPEEEKRDAKRPTIRLIKAPHITASSPQFTINAEWKAATPETAGQFSAVGYFFGRDLQDVLDVPIGLLSINWGGTRIEPWISRRSLSELPRSRDQMRELGQQQDTYNAMSAADRQQRLETLQAASKRQTAGYLDTQFTNDPGSQGKWFSKSLDDSSWKTTPEPRLYKDTEKSLANFDGGVWYRKTVDIPKAWAGKDLVLDLGSIDDSDITWFNGVRIGSTTEAHNQHRGYEVKGAIVKPGPATIAVLAIDSGGAGGMTGPEKKMRLRPEQFAKDAPESISLASEWRWKKGGAHSGPRPSTSVPNLAEPGTSPQDYSALHNGMLAAFTPYAVRGAIWYQGESNASEPDAYKEFLPLLIADWKREFKREKFPFGVVQLAAFKPHAPNQPAQGGWAFLREAQSHAAKTVPDTGIAVTTDIGDARDIHPRNKQDVAQRLALWALATVYGKDVGFWSGPTFDSMKMLTLKDGTKALEITFNHAEGGLKTHDGKSPGGFAVAGSDRVFHWATARISEGKVIVFSTNVADPIAVRYAWQDNPITANLVNAAGLPADGFRSDN